MFKLLTTLTLATFIIYGLDDMRLISASNFTIVEEPVLSSNSADASQTKSLTRQGKTTEKFTDRIVRLRGLKGEG